MRTAIVLVLDELLGLLFTWSCCDNSTKRPSWASCAGLVAFLESAYCNKKIFFSDTLEIGVPDTAAHSSPSYIKFTTISLSLGLVKYLIRSYWHGLNLGQLLRTILATELLRKLLVNLLSSFPPTCTPWQHNIWSCYQAAHSYIRMICHCWLLRGVGEFPLVKGLLFSEEHQMGAL
jgi:hypothetical protein